MPTVRDFQAKLEAIDWQNLTHAYGAAIDVPHLLLDLTEEDADIREEAIQEFHSNIWHQGTVYEASAYAVPFLIELLEMELETEKPEILSLLSLLATGSSYHEVHSPLDLAESKDPEARQELIDQELAWVRASRSAVCAGTPTFVRLLADPEAETRAAAAYLLGIAAESPAKNLQILKELYDSEEPEEVVRAAAVLAIGFLQPQPTAATEFLKEVCAGADEASCRVAAALGLFKLGSDFPDSAKKALLEVANAPEEVASVFDELTCVNIYIEGLECLAFSHFSEDPEAVLTLLIEALDYANSPQGSSIAGTILNLVFEISLTPAPTFADLPPHQKRALAAIVKNENLWAGSGILKVSTEAGQALKAAGLPTRRSALLLFLEGN